MLSTFEVVKYRLLSDFLVTENVTRCTVQNHKDVVFITKNLTPRRRKIMDELNSLRFKGQIQACWSHDGKLFAIGLNSKKTDFITCTEDIQTLLQKYPVPSNNVNEHP